MAFAKESSIRCDLPGRLYGTYDSVWLRRLLAQVFGDSVQSRQKSSQHVYRWVHSFMVALPACKNLRLIFIVIVSYYRGLLTRRQEWDVRLAVSDTDCGFTTRTWIIVWWAFYRLFCIKKFSNIFFNSLVQIFWGSIIIIISSHI